MALVRFKAAVDYLAGHLKAFGDNSAYIQAVTLVDSAGADAAAATAAKQDTIIGHVDGIETALTAVNASLDAIEAKQASGASTGVTSQSVVQATDSNWLNNIEGGVAAARGVVILGRSSSGSTSMIGTTTDRSLTTVNQPYSMTASRWNYAAATGGIVNTTTAVTVMAAGGASVRNYVTSIQVMAEALGTATELAIRDGAGGTVLWRTKIGTGGLTGGLSVKFPVPLKGTADTLLEIVTLTASGTGAVYFNAQGYQGA